MVYSFVLYLLICLHLSWVISGCIPKAWIDLGWKHVNAEVFLFNVLVVANVLSQYLRAILYKCQQRVHPIGLQDMLIYKLTHILPYKVHLLTKVLLSYLKDDLESMLIFIWFLLLTLRVLLLVVNEVLQKIFPLAKLMSAFTRAFTLCDQIIDVFEW